MSILTPYTEIPLLVRSENGLFSFFPQGVQRCFYIEKVPLQKVRGCHRHRFARMALSAASGSIKVYTQTPEAERIYELNQRGEWLLLGPHVWRMMYDFSPGAVLTVLASTTFNQTYYLDEPYHPILLDEASLALQRHGEPVKVKR
jgi:hypothetical protein